MIECETGRDDHSRSISFFELRQQAQTFCRDLRIRQDIFYGGELGFRQKSGPGNPVEQTFIEKLLRSDVRSNHPNYLVDLLRDGRDKERLSAFDDMRKASWRSRRSRLLEFGSDGRRFRDERQDLVVAGHAEVLMKLR